MKVNIKLLAALLSVLTLTGCMKYKDAFDAAAVEARDDAEAMSNAEQVFGYIDPKQDWNSIVNGDVTVTADAPMDGIAQVQVLTASPFGNSRARVLSEARAEEGTTVTLHYDAPSACQRLFAACVDAEGHYYIKGFAPGTQRVSFSGQNRSASRRAALPQTLPDISELTLTQGVPTYNNVRCRKANEGDNTSNISLWKDTQWEHDSLWVVNDGKESRLLFEADDFDADAKADLQAIIDGYLTHEKGWYQDNVSNVEKIRDSRLNQQHNYLTTTGDPILLTPVQINGSEQDACHILYYYYNPADLNGRDEVEYIKQLPKYKAIQVWRTASKTAALNGTSTYYSDKLFRLHTYALVYYGDGPGYVGRQAVSYEFPAGYKVGFICRKMKQGNWAQAEQQYGGGKNGECYGDGRLNTEINVWQLPNKNDNHFATAGFEASDPRFAFFAANQNLYMTVEDGSNRDFGDIVIQVESGVEVSEAEETEAPEAAAYTMCFEDRPGTADYDLNDVVLRCTRIDRTTLSLALVATGANDDVVIRGANGWELNNQEVHAIFRAAEPAADGNRFVNTVVGGTRREVQARYVEVDASVTIPDYLKGIYIENRTTGKTIRIAQQGEPPCAIIVPQDFQYPMEYQPITVAYANFIDWVQDVNASGDWYLFENANKVFPSLFNNW